MAINEQAESYYNKNCEDYEKHYKEAMGEWCDFSEIDYDNRLNFTGEFNYPNDYIENQHYLSNVFLNIQ